MKTTFLALATVSALTLSSAALAQAQSSGNPPAASQDLDADYATKVQSSPTTQGVVPKAGAITGQTGSQWLASKFRGTQVIGPDDSKLGSVDDIMFDRSGAVTGIVIGAGGFLGIGSKQVAFPLAEFEIVQGANGAADQLKLPLSKEQLAAAPEFKPYEPPRAAASTAPTRPTTSGSGAMAPPPKQE
jgi:hypothetical protein